jgi:predicted Zn-dependent peptidase
MFGGSLNIPDFDRPLQIVGGENNAFTNNDITNYHLTLPKENIETGFWLESDRMLSLAFSKKSLDTQRNVVIEEFKQRYLNQPYGDVWLFLRPLAYKKHPYMWATIGKEISHIENANIEDVKAFFYKHYAPNNAILVVAGDVDTENVKQLAQKWFGPIERRNVPDRNIISEPKQTKKRILKLKRNVPFDAIYLAFHMCSRNDHDFYATDLLSDILSNGDSSRLYNNLIKEKNLFSSLDAYILGSNDPGLFIISGKIIDGIDIKVAEKAILDELELIKNELTSDYELQKVKNKFESGVIFSEINILNKAMNLAFYENLGNANRINTELENYKNVTKEEIRNVAQKILTKENCSILYYYAEK